MRGIGKRGGWGLGLCVLLLLVLACEGEKTPKPAALAPKSQPESPLLRCRVELADASGQPQTTETTCATLKDPTRLKGLAVVAIEPDGLPLNQPKFKGQREGGLFVFEPGLAARLGGLYTRFEAARALMMTNLVNPAARQALPLLIVESPKGQEGARGFLRFAAESQRLEVSLAASGPEAALAPGLAARAYALTVIERFRPARQDVPVEERMQVAGGNTRRSWLFAFAHYVGALAAGRPDYAEPFIQHAEDRAWPLVSIEPELWHYVGQTPGALYRPEVLGGRIFAGLWSARGKLLATQRGDYDMQLFRWLFSEEDALSVLHPGLPAHGRSSGGHPVFDLSRPALRGLGAAIRPTDGTNRRLCPLTSQRRHFCPGAGTGRTFMSLFLGFSPCLGAPGTPPNAP